MVVFKSILLYVFGVQMFHRRLSGESPRNKDERKLLLCSEVYFYQRAVPPNVPICSALENTKNHKDWIVDPWIAGSVLGEFSRFLCLCVFCVSDVFVVFLVCLSFLSVFLVFGCLSLCVFFCVFPGFSWILRNFG